MAELASLVRLLQLASPSLPVGAYSYSQGMEAAVDAGIVRDASSARDWIGDVLELAAVPMEGALLLRLAQAWAAGDAARAARWNEELLASRETSELRAESVQMGQSLRRLVQELGLDPAGALAAIEEPAFVTSYAFAAVAWDIPAAQALAAWLFGWIENQVLAAVKAVPLGQTDAQRMLLALGSRIPREVERACRMPDDAIANLAPGLALLCARHETQYTRLFRS